MRVEQSAMAEAPRRRCLRELSLTGGRRVIRQGLLAILAFASLLSAAGFAFGLERARPFMSEIGPWRPWHSFALEAFGVPVMAPILVAAAARWAWRGGFPRGMLVLVIAIAEAVVLLVLALTVHLLDEQVEGTFAQRIAAYAQLAMVATAAAIFVVEPLVFILERRRLENEDPVVATARVVTRRRGAG